MQGKHQTLPGIIMHEVFIIQPERYRLISIYAFGDKGPRVFELLLLESGADAFIASLAQVRT